LVTQTLKPDLHQEAVIAEVSR